MGETITVSLEKDHYDTVVMVDKILMIRKSTVNEYITLIHLIDGTVLRVLESIKTLDARINKEK